MQLVIRKASGPWARTCARWLAASLLLVLAACVPYRPTLHLDESPQTIPAEVYVETLSDATPPEDREAPDSHSLSQTSPDEIAGDLAALVTKAILSDFSASGVFRSVSSNRARADLIIGGTIRRFHGQVTLPSWLLIPGLSPASQMFWGLIQEWAGVVELELTVSTPDGRLLGTYRGASSYHEVARHDHRFWAMPLYPAHVRLNEAFTEAVRQIRDQMLGDRERLVSLGGLR
ncbi:hypothetical protein [Nitrospira sp. Kam-Ns4a]